MAPVQVDSLNSAAPSPPKPRFGGGRPGHVKPKPPSPETTAAPPRNNPYE